MLSSHKRTNCCAKLADFGLAETIKSTGTKTGSKAGTAGYLAPEILEGRAAGTPSDIWALGCLLYAMLSVSLPFPTPANKGGYYQRVGSIDYTQLDLEPVAAAGDLCKDLLSRMFVKQPEKRLTIE